MTGCHDTLLTLLDLALRRAVKAEAELERYVRVFNLTAAAGRARLPAAGGDDDHPAQRPQI